MTDKRKNWFIRMVIFGCIIAIIMNTIYYPPVKAYGKRQTSIDEAIDNENGVSGSTFDINTTSEKLENLRNEVKEYNKEHCIWTDEERKMALGYLVMIDVNRGKDPASLDAKDVDALDYLKKTLEITNPTISVASGPLSERANLLAQNQRVLEYNSKRIELEQFYSKEIAENNEIMRKQTEAIADLNKQLDGIKSKHITKKIKKQIGMANGKKGKAKSNNLDIEKKIDEGARGGQQAAEKEASRLSRSLKYLGVALNGAIAAVDVYDLASDNINAKKNGGTAGEIWAERAIVGIDAYIAVVGMFTAAGVITVTTITSMPVIIGAAIVTVLAHTDVGNYIFKGLMNQLGESYQNMEDVLFVRDFGVGNVGEKMMEHFKDKVYMAEFTRRIKDKYSGRTKPANGVGALKPNIYLYPEEKTDVIVSFDHPELLTTVIPDYSGNWSVTAEPDGTLHSENGQDYSYLFYESETQPFFFGNKEGWLIKADERAERYTEILTEYGFNEKEIADFVEFWVEKLPEGVDYMMYPNVTEVIDKAMPVSFSTEPDSIFRIWFTFEVYDDQEVPEPEVEEFIRDGFTVVEWGGVILN